MHHSIWHRSLTQQALLPHRLSIAKALLAGGLLGVTVLSAQTPPAQTAPVPARRLTHRPSHSATPQLPAAQAAIPPAPAWPINDHPVPAAVSWNRDELRIDAANSSLQQILTDVATATGSTVEGVSKDERVFGSFGPAPARDVLAQLLQGSGYNILMVGDQGQGVPRQIILSTRNTNKNTQGVTRPSQEDNEDDSTDYPQYDAQPPNPPQIPQPPQPLRPGFPPDGSVPMRTPQQLPQQPQTQPGQSPNNQ
ncbi:MAG: hypothetical protein WB679_24140 [Terracidiphilus sp.]